MKACPPTLPPATEGTPVRKLDEYIEHAAECRNMARTATAAHRNQLEEMANTWDSLAQARKIQLQKQSEAADEGNSN
jgi:hypothetical protein